MRLPENIRVYGDTDYRGTCPTEQMEHITFFAQLRAQMPELGVIALHPKNEGKRHLHRYRHDVLMGLSVGACDIVIPGAPTFVCELKRRDHTKSKLSDVQVEWMTAAMAAGAHVCIALGWEAAMDAVKEWKMTNEEKAIHEEIDRLYEEMPAGLKRDLRIEHWNEELEKIATDLRGLAARENGGDQ